MARRTRRRLRKIAELDNATTDISLMELRRLKLLR